MLSNNQETINYLKKIIQKINMKMKNNYKKAMRRFHLIGMIISNYCGLKFAVHV